MELAEEAAEWEILLPKTKAEPKKLLLHGTR